MRKTFSRVPSLIPARPCKARSTVPIETFARRAMSWMPTVFTVHLHPYVGRTLLSVAVAVAVEVVVALALDLAWLIHRQSKINSNGDGQECPSHTRITSRS